MTEAERVSLIINTLEGGNAAEFGRKIGVSSPTASKMRNGSIGIRLQVNSIMTAYPQINRAWLETGEGYPGDLTVDLVKSHFQKKIDKQDKLIDYLIKRINELENQLDI